jgi:hypothetical protein
MRFGGFSAFSPAFGQPVWLLRHLLTRNLSRIPSHLSRLAILCFCTSQHASPYSFCNLLVSSLGFFLAWKSDTYTSRLHTPHGPDWGNLLPFYYLYNLLSDDIPEYDFHDPLQIF